MFQSSFSRVVDVDCGMLEADSDEVEELTEEAFRTNAEVGLKEAFLITRGTRRRTASEESWDLPGVGAVVWYVQGARRVGCIRQPITAVRSVGAVHNILI